MALNLLMAVKGHTTPHHTTPHHTTPNQYHITSSSMPLLPLTPPSPPASPSPLRFSSAVIASLVTSTPIISNQAFLDAYSFLDSSHVFIQGTQETELDVMKRVLQVRSGQRHTGDMGGTLACACRCTAGARAAPGRALRRARSAWAASCGQHHCVPPLLAASSACQADAPAAARHHMRGTPAH